MVEAAFPKLTRERLYEICRQHENHPIAVEPEELALNELTQDSE